MQADRSKGNHPFRAAAFIGRTNAMDLHLRGKSVLITGASRGIGAATAEAFAEEGSNVYLAARSTGAMQGIGRTLARSPSSQRHGAYCRPAQIGLFIGWRAKPRVSMSLSTMLAIFPAVRSTRLTRRRGVTKQRETGVRQVHRAHPT